ncbi:phospholipase [Austwickia chelonae]|uniref:phospholipase n=1 Tax=Austwickia chelonae TaxID=100225 RepID=UPI001967F7F3|nr:phospholipase [Austwickia chelonae]
MSKHTLRALVAGSFAAALAAGAVIAPAHAASPAPVAPAAPATSTQRPIYAIAHRVLTTGGVDDALKMGYNALEVDLTAWKDGWYADHDGIPTSKGDTVEPMFKRIAENRKAGKNVSFVWLDIKNPDHCSSGDPKWKHCSVAHLQSKAREILEPAGIKVLYGFYKTVGGGGWKTITSSLNKNEAVAVSGTYGSVKQQFNEHGKNIPPAQRVADYGLFDIRQGFGDCGTKGNKTCNELRRSSQARDEGELGRTFGWTIAKNQDAYVDGLLGKAHVDGMITGFKATHFYSHSHTEQALKSITSWVEKHSSTHRMATNADKPW